MPCHRLLALSSAACRVTCCMSCHLLPVSSSVACRVFCCLPCLLLIVLSSVVCQGIVLARIPNVLLLLINVTYKFTYTIQQSNKSAHQQINKSANQCVSASGRLLYSGCGGSRCNILQYIPSIPIHSKHSNTFQCYGNP